MSWYKAKRSKFGNAKTEYNGVLYHSKLEARYARDLDFLKRAGEIKDWERQIPIQLIVNDEKICKYILDFKIRHNDNTIEWIECKGFETAVWKLKKKLFELVYLKDKDNERYTIVK